MRGQGLFFEKAWKLLQDDSESNRLQAQSHLDLKANTLAVGIKRLRERLAQAVRSEVAAALHEPNQETVNEEIQHLIRSLAHAGGLPALHHGHSDLKMSFQLDDGR